MGPIIDQVETSKKLPEITDIAIIGGGIIGVATAMFLAERGHRVALFEKGHISGEQSSRNWGWCRQTGRDSRELDLIRESTHLWESMNERTGRETGFRSTGVYYLGESEDKAEGYEIWAKIAREHGLDAQVLSSKEAQAVATGTTHSILSALTTKGDGRAEPQKAVPAMAAKAISDGALIFENCAVRGIEQTNGHVSSIITEKGVVQCQAVVIAGGAWSRLICSQLGLRLPQLKVRSSVFRTNPIDAAIETALYFKDFALRKRLDGGFTVAAEGGGDVDIVPDSFAFFKEFFPALASEWRTIRLRIGKRFFDELLYWRNRPLDQVSIYEKIRTLDPDPDIARNLKAMKQLQQAFPAFRHAVIAQQWAGYIDTMPDVIPVISPVEHIGGLIIATGFSGHGFGIGPAAGHLIADMVTGDKPLVDPSAFRFSRFQDKSKLVIEKWG